MDVRFSTYTLTSDIITCRITHLCSVLFFFLKNFLYFCTIYIDKNDTFAVCTAQQIGKITMSDIVRTDSFYTMANSVEGITDADYQRVKPCVETVKSLAQTTYQSIYIIDFFRHNFLYVSDNPTLLCGQTADTMRQMGYDFFHTYVPEEEQPMLDNMNVAGFKAFYDVPVEHRRECMLSFDFHLRHGDHLMLVNHKSTPMALTPNGSIWLVLAMVSISPHKEAGHIEFFRFYSRERLEYMLDTDNWIHRDTVTLSPEERQVLMLSAQGYTMKEIAVLICRSFDTVKFYRRQLFKKLNAQSVTEALTFATNYGLI